VCSSCYDHFHAPLTLTSEWQQYTLAWGRLQQQGFGDAETSVSPAQLYAIQFQWDEGQAFDLWLDDVAFTTTSREAGSGGAGGNGGGAGVEEPATDLSSLRLSGGGCTLGSPENGAWRGVALLILGGALVRARRRRRSQRRAEP
jgi:hypothetical protein